MNGIVSLYQFPLVSISHISAPVLNLNKLYLHSANIQNSLRHSYHHCWLYLPRWQIVSVTWPVTCDRVTTSFYLLRARDIRLVTHQTHIRLWEFPMKTTQLTVVVCCSFRDSRNKQATFFWSNLWFCTFWPIYHLTFALCFRILFVIWSF